MAQPVHSLVLGPTETPAIRCKTCKVPLPDATRKNCERCRRNRTESYNRWKRSVEARKTHGKNLISLPTVETHLSSARPSNLNIGWMKPATTSAASSQPPHRSHPGSGTPAQLAAAAIPSSTAPLDHNLNERDHHEHQISSSQLPRGAPVPVSSLPHRVNVPEYQWGEELVDALLALPPRSNFLGQFSVIADPDVDNFKRAEMFQDQVRSKGLPISGTQRPVSHNPGASRGHAIGLYCICEIGCQGRFVVSVDNDTTHPYGVPGQRISVALLHTSSR
ncbi:hypothetical protein BJY52DRAFT_1273041 [Lactarius psammicola]|nr:hypothetical protein BJY52DRAFT_1273041 [Lactarius psammicola]